MMPIPYPFLATEALADGLVTFRELRRFHAAVYPGVWVARGADLGPADRAYAAWLWSGRRAVLTGLSASALHRAKWVEPTLPAEVVHGNRRPPRLIVVRGDRLHPGETQTLDGMPITTPARTAFDLGRRLRRDDAVQRIDALMNATGVAVEEIADVATRHRGVRGLANLRTVLPLVDAGAESPWESRLRLLLLDNGFPKPQSQIRVFDEGGLIAARLDLGWRRWRVGVDFEGAHHWTDPGQRDRDAERYGVLPELGWVDIRATSGMLTRNPRRLLDRVGAALLARGCPRTWP